MRTIRGRTRAALAAIVTAGLLVPAHAVSAETPSTTTTTTTDPAAAAAGWLTGQFIDDEDPDRDGARLQTTFDFGAGPQTSDDPGLTIDAVLGLAAAGLGADEIADAAAWLDHPRGVASYAGDGDPTIYAGATAKLILLAGTVGADPRDFGDEDLIDRLEGLESEDGRFADAFDPDDEWGADWSNTITQSLAIVALERRAGGASQDAVEYLAAQACEDGGFPLQLSDDPAQRSPCESEVDATGFVVQALVAGDATAAAEAAAAWLVTIQAGDGSFGSEDAARNSNSTGLAAAALDLVEETPAARDARRWLASVQACDGSLPFAPEDSGDVQRATAQGLLGLASLDLVAVTSAGASGEVADFTCPRRFADVGYGVSPHAPAIEDLARRDVLLGDEDGAFRPRLALTRGQIASMIGRAFGVEEVSETRFTDVGGSPHAGYVNALAERGIVRGYADDSYRPSQQVTRDQIAALLARWLELDLDPGAQDAFTDITGNAHRTSINALAEVGIARGAGDGRYGPKHPLVRDQAASLLVRALDLAADS
jgi:hypothetical protein